MTDLVNGMFELFGGFFVYLSIRKTYKQKKVVGISIWYVLFFTVWGYWNLWFYPAYGAWVSFVGGFGVCITNTIWLGMYLYYGHYLDGFMLYALYIVADGGELAGDFGVELDEQPH